MADVGSKSPRGYVPPLLLLVVPMDKGDYFRVRASLKRCPISHNASASLIGIADERKGEVPVFRVCVGA